MRKLSAHKRRGIWYNVSVLTDKASGRGESPSHPNGGDSSPPYLIWIAKMAKSIGELSVFVDESGSFDSSLEPSRFYIVTLLCHDQADVVKPFVDELESQLGYLGYPDTCIHAGPLLRREEDFRLLI